MAFTVDDLLHILKECAGESLSGDAAVLADVTFEELGYDSLALLETAARIEHDLGVALPDEDVTELKTPGAMVALVNELLGQ